MRYHHPGTSQLSGEVKLILLAFPTTYFPDQGYCQLLHTRNKYPNRLDMSNIGEAPFKLTNLQSALKKLADKHHRDVRISWNDLFFWKLITFILKMHLHSFCFVLTGMPVYISLALNYFQNKILFQKNYRKGAIFKKSAWRGAILQKRLKTTALACRNIFS